MKNKPTKKRTLNPQRCQGRERCAAIPKMAQGGLILRDPQNCGPLYYAHRLTPSTAIHRLPQKIHMLLKTITCIAHIILANPKP